MDKDTEADVVFVSCNVWVAGKEDESETVMVCILDNEGVCEGE